MTQDTEDVVARAICWAFSAEDEECQTKCLDARKCMATEVQECFKRDARAAIEALQPDRQSLSDRIDELEGVVDDAASCLKEAGHTISRLEHGSLGNRNFAYVAADHARAALHQEGIAP